MSTATARFMRSGDSCKRLNTCLSEPTQIPFENFQFMWVSRAVLPCTLQLPNLLIGQSPEFSIKQLILRKPAPSKMPLIQHITSKGSCGQNARRTPQTNVLERLIGRVASIILIESSVCTVANSTTKMANNNVHQPMQTNSHQWSGQITLYTTYSVDPHRGPHKRNPLRGTY